uniref:Uncharacterized protein n=1 Tax=Utricularia reniformis TaxID=192314 RepID=A0A1Y0B0Z8_9LAMI|nr:hypothetical protein AEK19_MT0903 [Utricularia reniformis]ART31132.1 hypothetical protein AEK19_MT0903 [Utricularia reniformis]
MRSFLPFPLLQSSSNQLTVSLSLSSLDRLEMQWFKCSLCYSRVLVHVRQRFTRRC